MTMPKSEKPMVTIVMQRTMVFSRTFPFLSDQNSSQMQSPISAVIKKTAPVLYGRPNPLTNRRSKPAATFGRYGMKRNTRKPRITTPTTPMPIHCQKL